MEINENIHIHVPDHLVLLKEYVSVQLIECRHNNFDEADLPMHSISNYLFEYEPIHQHTWAMMGSNNGKFVSLSKKFIIFPDCHDEEAFEYSWFETSERPDGAYYHKDGTLVNIRPLSLKDATQIKLDEPLSFQLDLEKNQIVGIFTFFY